MSATIDVRSTASSIAQQFTSSCCHANVTPVPPRTKVGTHSIIMPFSCNACAKLYDVTTGKSCRINLVVESDEEEDNDDDEPGRRAKRKKTNGRPAELVREMLSMLLTGQMYSDYSKAAVVQNRQHIHHSTFERYLGKLLPWIEKLQDEMVELVRYLIVRYGETIDKLMLTNDFFWQIKGHYSPNGSGTICDLKSGGIISFRHYCRGKDSMSDRGGYEFTSAAMDAMGFGEMLAEVVQWMEEDVPLLLEEHDLDIQPRLAGCVLDGDASTNSLVPVVLKTAAGAGDTNYCKDFKCVKCTNHLGKNGGAQAFKIGHAVHKDCACPNRMTQAGTINARQPKLHRGCNTESHPLVKSYQRAISAALRGAKDRKDTAGYEGKSMQQLAIAGIEEMVNHLQDIHDGPGFLTGERRVCRLHPQTKEDGSPYISRQFNDCITFNLQMQAWLKQNIINCINDVVDPDLGAVCQNASERVGDVALQYRDKHTILGPTHYICSTGLAMAHVNNICIHKFRRQLAARGAIDSRIEAFDCMETRLFKLIGLPYSKHQATTWRAAVALRAKKSEYRQTTEYKRKRKVERAKLTVKRGAYRTDHAFKYKGATGGRAATGQGAAAHGTQGACTCTGQCMRNCPCRSEQQACTAACHAGRSCKNCTGMAGSSSGAGSSGGRHAWPQAEPVPPPLDATLIDRVIYYNFCGSGWAEGVVLEENEDVANEDDEGEMANYLVYYEKDDSDVYHLLLHDYYSSDANGPVDSWCLQSPT